MPDHCKHGNLQNVCAVDPSPTDVIRHIDLLHPTIYSQRHVVRNLDVCEQYPTVHAPKHVTGASSAVLTISNEYLANLSQRFTVPTPKHSKRLMNSSAKGGMMDDSAKEDEEEKK